MTSRRLVVLAAVAAALCAGACHPPAAEAGTARPSSLARAIQVASARATILQSRLLRLSARLDRADGRLARLESQLAWTEGMLAGETPGARVMHALGRRPVRLLMEVARAQRALAAAQRYSTSHPVLAQLVAAERRVQRLTAARRNALTAVQFPPSRAEPGAPITRGAWAVRLLAALHLPDCGANRVAVVTWETAENTTAAWNPLATTLPAPGAGRFNRSGVRVYPTLEAGVAATADTLRLGYYTHGYGWIVYRLAQCASPDVTARAINASDWCRGCAQGAYVTDMLADVERAYPLSAAARVAEPPLRRR